MKRKYKADVSACGFQISVITARSNQLLIKIPLISVCMHVPCVTTGTEVLYLAACQVQPAAMKD